MERFTRIEKRLGVFAHAYLLFFFVVGLILFRVEGITMAVRYLGIMFGIGAKGLIDDTFLMYFANGKWILLAGILLSMPIAPWCRKRIETYTNVYQFVSTLGLALIFGLSLLVCIKSSYNPFIYFNF
jgi:hypothetical protein